MLAQQFDCSPSQINYVLTTRFNNDRGYIIESKRGGGGYIRIFKVEASKYSDLDRILYEGIGDSITLNRTYDLIDIFKEKGIISQREQNIMKRSLSDRAFNKIFHEDRNSLRADIFKEMLLTIIGEE
jgi:transcriptional regulator of stress and heat shock response